MIKRLPRCVLHIGCEKTGSSTIQAALAFKRRGLFWKGILYPFCGSASTHGSQWNFALAAKSEVWNTELGKKLDLRSREQAEEFRKKLRRQLTFEVCRGFGCHSLVISSEHFHSRLTTQGDIQALRSFLEPFVKEFEVVVFFRRQDRVALSLFSTHLKSGIPNPKPFFPEKHLPEACYYRYDELYEQWCSVFGKDAVRCAIYPEQQTSASSLLEEFSRLAGIPSSWGGAPELENRSLDALGSSFLSRINTLFAANHPSIQGFDRRVFTQTLERIRPGRFHPFDKKCAREFAAKFSGNNERLRALAFPGVSGPLFDDFFDDYPEEPGQFSDSADDMALVGAEVSRHFHDRMNSIKSRMENISKFVKSIPDRWF